MSLQTPDRIKETTTTTGTGNITLLGRESTHFSFQSGVGVGNTCHYVIAHMTKDEVEVGLGTLLDAVTLRRDSVYTSSNGNAKVAFTAGVKEVFVATTKAFLQTLMTESSTNTVTNKTISAGSNTITGLTNANLANGAAIANSKLANSTISGTALGGTLPTLSGGTGITGSYNGTTAAIISVDGTVVTLTATQTLTNKTLVDPEVINSLLTTSTTFAFLPTAATTVNLAGAATVLNVGANTGVVNLAHNLNVANDVSVTGNVSILGGTGLSTQSNLLTIGVASLGATDVTANSGGLKLKGATDKDFRWYSSTGAWTSTEHVNLVTGKEFKINVSTFFNETALTAASTTYALLNVNTTTINFGGAATTINIGAGSGTTAIANNVTIAGTLGVTGATTLSSTLGVTGATTLSSTLGVTGATTLSNTLNVTGASTFSSTIAVTGTVSTPSASMNLFNTTVATVNFAGAATAINIGAGSGTTTINHDLVVVGNMTIQGTTTSVNTVNLVVKDKNIELATVGSPTNVTADGGGITLHGTTDKTLNWLNSTGAWTSSEDFNLVAGKVYKIGNVLSISESAFSPGVATYALANTTVTNLSIGGAATTLGLGASTGTTTVNNNLSVTGTSGHTGAATFSSTLAVTGSVTTPSASMNLFNATATTINFGGAATTLNLGAATGTTTIANNLSVTGTTTHTGLTTFSGGLTSTPDITVNGLTVGRGGGNIVGNTVLGAGAGASITTGNQTVAIGYNAGNGFVSGSANAFLGYGVSQTSAVIAKTVAIGRSAGPCDPNSSNASASDNVFIGYYAGNTTARTLNNVFVGSGVGSTAIDVENCVFLGASAGAALTTNLLSFGAITGGSGYTNGTYNGVTLTRVSGPFTTGPVANITVSGGAVTGCTLVSSGSGIGRDTVFTCPAASIGGTGSGWSVVAGTVEYPNYNVGIGVSALAGLTKGGNNITVGYNAGSNITTGSTNIIIGHNVLAPVAVNSNQMSIGNLIFATGGFGTGTSVGVGKIGIKNNAPSYDLDVTGTFRATSALGSGYNMEFYDTSSGSRRISFDPFNSYIEMGRSGGFYTRMGFGSQTVSFVDSGTTGNTMASIGAGSITVNTVTSGTVWGATLSTASLKIKSVLYGITTATPAIDCTVYATDGSNNDVSKIRMYNGDSGNVIMLANGLGKVGIKNTNPTYDLDVTGTIGASTAVYAPLVSAKPPASGAGNTLTITGSDAVSGSGGDTLIQAGVKVTSGTDGKTIIRKRTGVTSATNLVEFQDASSNIVAKIDGNYWFSGRFQTYVQTGNNANEMFGVGTLANLNLSTYNGHTVVGYNAGNALTSGAYNVLIGHSAGGNVTAITTGVFIGYQSGYSASNSTYSAAVGYQAGLSAGNYCAYLGAYAGVNATGWSNVAVGYQTLQGTGGSASGGNNTAVGYQAGFTLTTGTGNFMGGYQAGYSLTTGINNVLIGYQSAYSMTDRSGAVCIGQNAGTTAAGGSSAVIIGNSAGQNVSQSGTVAIGLYALQYGTGVNNVAVGSYALRGVNGTSTGQYNIAFGGNAGVGITSGSQNTLMGYNAGGALTVENNNTLIGYVAGQLLTSSSNVVVGYNAAASQTTNGTLTAVGYGAMSSATGAELLAIGNYALRYGTGSYNIGIGSQAGYGVNGTTTAANGVFIGWNAGLGITTGNDCTFTGYRAGVAVTSGGDNTFYGSQAGLAVTTGTKNTVIGSSAKAPAIKIENTVIGYNAGYTGMLDYCTIMGSGAGSGAIGQRVTAVGAYAGQYAPDHTTAVGMYAAQGASNASGARNSAFGYMSLVAFTTGNDNVAAGYLAGTAITTGFNNVVVGSNAGSSLTTGSLHTFIGTGAGQNYRTSTGSTLIGYRAGWNNVASATGGPDSSYNTSVGCYAGTYYYGNYCTAIGYVSGPWNNGPNDGSSLTTLGAQSNQNSYSYCSTLGTLVGGSGYTNGTYRNVVLTLSSGSPPVVYPLVDITVSGGAVTAVTLIGNGIGVSVGTVFTCAAASIGGTGSGFTITATATTAGARNTVVGASSGNGLATNSDTIAIGYNALGGTYGTYTGNQVIAIGNNAGAYLTANTLGGLSNLYGGTGYTDGTYNNVTLTLLNGQAPQTYPTANITVSGGAVTAATIVTGGQGVKPGTVFTCPAASIGGTGSGWRAVSSVTSPYNTVLIGHNAGISLTTGSAGSGGNNVYIGDAAGSNGLATANCCVLIGQTASTQGNNEVAVGYGVVGSGGQSVILGNQAGTTSGIRHVLIGQNAGNAYAAGNSGEVYIGWRAGQTNTAGIANTLVGYQAGQSQGGSYNTLVGYSSGCNNNVSTNSPGDSNTFFGANYTHRLVNAAANVGVGRNVLNLGTSSSNNVAVGHYALQLHTTSVATFGAITGGSGYVNNTYNGVTLTLSSGPAPLTYPVVNITVSGGAVTGVTLVSGGTGVSLSTVFTCPAASIGGSGSGWSVPVSTVAGGNNIAIGYNAGYNLGVGATGNIIIGYNLDAPSNTGGNQLTIGNLIFGIGGFGTGTSLATGKVGIKNNAPTYDFDVTGDIRSTSIVYSNTFKSQVVGSGAANDLNITASPAISGNGGNVILTPSVKVSSGTDGSVIVKPPAGSTAAYFKVQDSSANDWMWFDHSTKSLYFYTNTGRTTQMYIGGYIGGNDRATIGTSSGTTIELNPGGIQHLTVGNNTVSIPNGITLFTGSSNTNGLTITSSTATNANVTFGSQAHTVASGVVNHLNIPLATGFAPTSGTGVWNAIGIQSTINQTGGANGISRGIYINPTLTAAASWLALESTAGQFLINTGVSTYKGLVLKGPQAQSANYLEVQNSVGTALNSIGDHGQQRITPDNRSPAGLTLIAGTSFTLTVTLKALTSNVATLTFTGTHRMSVGDPIWVAGVDSTFNGVYTITGVTASTVSYAKTAADVGSTAGTGTIVPGPTRTFAVTNKQLTSNVAYLTYTGTAPFFVGSTINVAGVDSTFDGTYTVTYCGSQVVRYAKTAADVGSTASSGGVIFGNVTGNLTEWGDISSAGAACSFVDSNGVITTKAGFRSLTSNDSLNGVDRVNFEVVPSTTNNFGSEHTTVKFGTDRTNAGSFTAYTRDYYAQLTLAVGTAGTYVDFASWIGQNTQYGASLEITLQFSGNCFQKYVIPLSYDLCNNGPSDVLYLPIHTSGKRRWPSTLEGSTPSATLGSWGYNAGQYANEYELIGKFSSNTRYLRLRCRTADTATRSEVITMHIHATNVDVTLGSVGTGTDTTGLLTVGAITGGSGYASGGTTTYSNVALTLSSGSWGIAPRANITVTAGVVTAVVLTSSGMGVTTGTVASAAQSSLGGTGSGFSVPLTITTDYAPYGATPLRIGNRTVAVNTTQPVATMHIVDVLGNSGATYSFPSLLLQKSNSAFTNDYLNLWNAEGVSLGRITSGPDLILGSSGSVLGSGTRSVTVVGNGSAASTNYGSIGLGNPTTTSQYQLGAVDFYSGSNRTSSIQGHSISGNTSGRVRICASNDSGATMPTLFDISNTAAIFGSIGGAAASVPVEIYNTTSNSTLSCLTVGNMGSGSTTGSRIAFRGISSNGTQIDFATISGVKTANDTVSTLTGDMVFATTSAAGSATERLRLTGAGVLQAGTVTGTSAGNVLALAGGAASTSGAGGGVTITGGAAVGTGNGASITLTPSIFQTTGTDGKVIVKQPSGGTGTTLFEVQTSGGSTAFSVAATGDVVSIKDINAVNITLSNGCVAKYFTGTNANSQSNMYGLTVQGIAAGAPGLQVKAAASSAPDSVQIQSSGGSVYWTFDKLGRPSSSNTTPTIAAGTGAGTTPTISISGTDVNGTVTLTTGTGPATSATVATITFSSAYSAAPKTVILTPANAATRALGAADVFVDPADTTTALWKISIGATNLPASTGPYKWNYLVVG